MTIVWESIRIAAFQKPRGNWGSETQGLTWTSHMPDWPRTLSLALSYPYHYAGVRDEGSLETVKKEGSQPSFPRVSGKELLKSV